MQQVTVRYDFYHVLVFLNDDESIAVKGLFNEYLARTSKSQGISVKDEFSDEEVLLNFMFIRSMHFNDVTGKSPEDLVRLRQSLQPTGS